MGDPRILRPVLIGLSIFLLEGAQAFAPPVQDAELQLELDSMANDTSRPDGWKYHDLGEKTHCLTEFSNNASVLYRDAPTSSKKLLIYLEGGGSCFDDASCTGVSQPPPKNRNGYSSTDFLNDTKLRDYLYLRTGLGDPPSDGSTTANPFNQMNMVMIPYCTGDLHAGTTTVTSGANKYWFWGHINFKRALKLILAKYSDVTTIWLMGTSAGAGGAAIQFRYVRKQFNVDDPNNVVPKQVHLIEDSSPVVPPSVDPTRNIAIWGAYLPGCDTAVNAEVMASEDPTELLPAPAAASISLRPGSCSYLVQTRRANRNLNEFFRYGRSAQPPTVLTSAGRQDERRLRV